MEKLIIKIKNFLSSKKQNTVVMDEYQATVYSDATIVAEASVYSSAPGYKSPDFNGQDHNILVSSVLPIFQDSVTPSEKYAFLKSLKYEVGSPEAWMEYYHGQNWQTLVQ